MSDRSCMVAQCSTLLNRAEKNMTHHTTDEQAYRLSWIASKAFLEHFTFVLIIRTLTVGHYKIDTRFLTMC